VVAEKVVRWHCPTAWTGGGFEADVVVEVENDVISAVRSGVPFGAGMRPLTGVVFPGFANTHSHVFHRLLRGHVGSSRGDFWSWRDAMFAVADALDPDSYRAVAAATFKEMVAAGYTSVAEFHYLHHQPGGMPYADQNVMGDALVDAATEAGIRLTVLDTCYLSAGFGEAPVGAQLRFADSSVERWAERVDAWKPAGEVVVGAAIHSVRAVDPRSCAVVASCAEGGPLHIHLSEQPAENEGCVAAYGATPTQVLADAGALGSTTTVVHATHVAAADIALLAESGARASICPTTERWLADGIGPTRALADAGVPLAIGSDSQAVIDPFEEVRLLELHQRLATGQTGSHDVADLIRAGTGSPVLVAGGPSDLVAVDMTTPRTAGVAAEGVLFAATAADVTGVVSTGRRLLA
jgi:formiminoglutamate deiminase